MHANLPPNFVSLARKDAYGKAGLVIAIEQAAQTTENRAFTL
jgi:hypothetical protein